jgi:hypothetical protein
MCILIYSTVHEKAACSTPELFNGYWYFNTLEHRRGGLVAMAGRKHDALCNNRSQQSDGSTILRLNETHKMET